MLLAVAAAVLTVRLMPPRYEATVRLLVGRVGSASGLQADLATDQQLAKTYAELAVTRSVLEQVIEALQLPTQPELLSRQVKVKLTPDTRLLDVTVDAQAPDEAGAIATAIGNELVSLGQADLSDVGTSIQRNARQDLDSVGQALRRDEDELQQVEASLASGSADPDLLARRDRLRSNVLEEQRTRSGLYDILLRTAPSTGAVRLVSPATVPLAPTNPALAQVILVSAPLGALLAAGVIVLLDVLDTRVRTPAQLPLGDGLRYLG